MTPVHRTRATCRACDGERLRPFLSLGPMPLANAFLRSPDEFAGEPRYPLDVHLCEDCSLVQLLYVVDPEVLFRNYLYVTGTSETIAEHNRGYADTLVGLLGLGPADLVVEVASNDGSLLRCFQARGVRALGIEPATNIAEMARAAGVESLNVFFDSATARDVRAAHGPARAVVGNNVLAHVDETRDFLEGCRALLDRDGLVVVEVPYLGELLERLEYDTIYHEHLCYFSATALLRLFEGVGLSIVRLDRVPVHGGSLRVYAAARDRVPEHAPAALALAAEERARGMTEPARYERFAADVAENRRAMRELLERLRADGRRVAGYGASAKGNTLLNFCGLDGRWVEFIADRNPLKVGRWTPGMHIPVVPVSTLAERPPDYLLVLAWNFADEIMRQQRAYRERGGRFILPIPLPEVA